MKNELFYAEIFRFCFEVVQSTVKKKLVKLGYLCFDVSLHWSIYYAVTLFLKTSANR